MAEKMDFRKFYEDTKPSKELIDILDSMSKRKAFLSKEKTVEIANKTFGMLAHLRITNNDTFAELAIRLPQMGISDRDYLHKTYDVLQNLKISQSVFLNPTALPTIQRYAELFDAYEKQNGIENPLSK